MANFKFEIGQQVTCASSCYTQIKYGKVYTIQDRRQLGIDRSPRYLIADKTAWYNEKDFKPIDNINTRKLSRINQIEL